MFTLQASLSLVIQLGMGCNAFVQNIKKINKRPLYKTNIYKPFDFSSMSKPRTPLFTVTFHFTEMLLRFKFDVIDAAELLAIEFCKSTEKTLRGALCVPIHMNDQGPCVEPC